ncbi:MAG: hypothetical protein B6I36_11100 [Desulfobacteraceae bacterium 4572_35.1]|nr:MAG: hypothetical protein B6I36_11100 [Desulfobacteraceae bacterium 4572_35.1]
MQWMALELLEHRRCQPFDAAHGCYQRYFGVGAAAVLDKTLLMGAIAQKGFQLENKGAVTELFQRMPVV